MKRHFGDKLDHDSVHFGTVNLRLFDYDQADDVPVMVEQAAKALRNTLDRWHRVDSKWVAFDGIIVGMFEIAPHPEGFNLHVHFIGWSPTWNRREITERLRKHFYRDRAVCVKSFRNPDAMLADLTDVSWYIAKGSCRGHLKVHQVAIERMVGSVTGRRMSFEYGTRRKVEVSGVPVSSTSVSMPDSMIGSIPVVIENSVSIQNCSACSDPPQSLVVSGVEPDPGEQFTVHQGDQFGASFGIQHPRRPSSRMFGCTGNRATTPDGSRGRSKTRANPRR